MAENMTVDRYGAGKVTKSFILIRRPRERQDYMDFGNTLLRLHLLIFFKYFYSPMTKHSNMSPW